MLYLLKYAQDYELLHRPVEPCRVLRLVYPGTVAAAVLAAQTFRIDLVGEIESVAPVS